VVRRAALLVAAAVALSVPPAVTAATPAPAPARYIPTLETGAIMPPIPLVGQDARRFTLADLHGDAVAVSFIYTRCRDPRMCPLISAKFARAQARIGPAAIRLVLVSLDPAYDTPAILTRYGRAFGQDPRRLTFATGDARTIDELAQRLGIATATTAPGTLVHTDALVIIDPRGRIARTIPGDDWSSDDVVAAARATLPAGGGPLITLHAFLAAASERCGQASAGLGSRALLLIAGALFAAIGGAFWWAFRHAIFTDRSSPARTIERTASAKEHLT
jgi:cytochrome oxidase Cu insertion factor (SCO1/SenC/PrrC family)